MFNQMNPQMLQMMMQQQGSMPQNMAPQIPAPGQQQGMQRPQMPQQPIQPNATAAPNGGMFGAMANNPMLQGMMGGQRAQNGGMAGQMMQGYHGSQLPWQQGFSSQGLNNSQIANPANMNGIQGFMGRNGIPNPFTGPASAAPMTTEGLPVGQAINGAVGAGSADAGATAAASSMPEWMTALMAMM